ncbi:MAG: putative oxidoreductase [candidate division BRC1 bacterium ADurb.BinA364]|nr:MAG: putative oxidoreductase [candidate division BRC1 bacterium ADurb.BinA364]
MIYRRFGRTELRMPVFSCGGMRYQHAWKENESEEIPAASQANLEACIRRALELGINHIETARGYGTSEQQLGRILPGLPRDSIIVQTKAAPADSPADFLASFDKSMARLGLDHVDLLGLHGINNAQILDWAIRPGGCLEAAQRLRGQGRVRFIGFSTHAPLEVILRAIDTGGFDYINLHWYWIFQDNWPAIEAAARHDMGVFIISPSDKGGQLFNPPARLAELCRPLSPLAFNDLFCLSHPEIHTLSVGAARPSDFDAHVECLEHLGAAKDVLEPILDRLDKAYVDALGERWARQWSQGLPSWEETPGGINIPFILRLWNLARAFGMEEFARYRYNMLGGGGHWVPGYKAADADSLDFGDCLKDSPFAAEMPQRLKEAHAALNRQDEKRLSQR